jgi:hypothetical protein
MLPAWHGLLERTEVHKQGFQSFSLVSKVAATCITTRPYGKCRGRFGHPSPGDGSDNPFQSPHEFASPQFGQRAPSQGGGMAIAGFVLGLLGLAASCCPLAGLPVNIVGLVLSIKGLPSQQRALAIAGIVLCAIGMVLTVINMAIGGYLAATGQHPLLQPPAGAR